MDHTTKLNLKLPEGTDPAKISDINDNMEAIDAAMPLIVYSQTDPPENPVTGMIWLKPVS